MQTWTRSLKSIYRREPVISLVVIGASVNVAIGGLTEHWALMSVGLSVVGVAIALGVRQFYARPRPIPSQGRSPYVLPPARDSSLPMLTISKKAPPRR